MPNDMITLKALGKELSETLNSGRINRIASLGNDSYLFTVRARGTNRALFLSAKSDTAGVYITESEHSADEIPNNFCMALRKRLIGGIMESFSVENEDRIIKIDILSRNELNDAKKYSLYAEIMGGASNLILVSDGNIIDAAKRIINENSRPVYPGADYVLPPRGKILLSDPDAVSVLDSSSTAKEVIYRLNGLSPESATELLRLRDSVGAAKALRQMNDMYSSAVYSPVAVPGSPNAFYAYRYGNLTDVKPFPTLSEAIDFCRRKAVAERERSARARRSEKLISALEKKLLRHIAGSKKVLADNESGERYKELGEILKCNFYRLQKGMSIIECDDFYNSRSVKIELNPTFSPKKNIERYFKLYAKSKGAKRFAAEDLTRSEEALDRVKEIKTYIRNCKTEAEFSEIEQEILALSGKPKEQPNQKQRRPKKTPPYRLDFQGFRIYVGRNSVQNEKVTFELAAPDDIWLHAKNFHGGHGLIVTEGRSVPEAVILKAASIVARFSENCDSPRADIDYTLRKRVKRLKGVRVTYTDYKTVSVKPMPEEEL